MKRLIPICLGLIVCLSCVSKAGDVSLWLVEKDASWNPVPGGASGELTYKAEGPTFFDYTFDGTGLEPNTSYTLIYYPDPWPGTGLIILGSDNTDGNGEIILGGSVNTGSLPKEDDANYPTGAKIWLVLSSDVNTTTNQMTAWHPTEYLFESNLIIFPLSVTSDARSKGYWKHQVKANQSGKGNPDYNVTELLGFTQYIFDHFYANDIEIENVTFIGEPAAPLDMDALDYMLNINQGGSTMEERAKQQFLALLLNMASEKLALNYQAALNGATASQAIVYINDLMTDPDTNYELAKDIAETINKGQAILEDWIPLSTPYVAFSTGSQMIFPLAKTFRFDAAAPNPFNPITYLRFELPEAARVSLCIYSISGRLVAAPVEGWVSAGPHEAAFDGSHAEADAIEMRDRGEKTKNRSQKHNW